MSDRTLENEAFAASVDWSAKGKPLAEDAKAMLELPQALLAIEGLPMPFGGAATYPVTQAKVLEAAQHIIDNRPADAPEQVFHSQASVMAHASQQYGWLTGSEMRLCAIPNYMHLPPQPEAEKAARTEELDMLIDVLRSGAVTTREGSRKAFPDMDTDAVWDKHEARKKSWAEEQQQRSKTRSNPCLGM